MSEQPQAVFDLMKAREQMEYLEQDLSDALQLLYDILAWLLALVPAGFEQKFAKVVRAKILQLPQGCPIGRRLMELDEQFGGLLESKGIWLARWVYEPRERGDE